MGLAHLLDNTAEVKRKTRTATDQGGFTHVDAGQGAFPARLSPATVRDRELGGEDAARATHALYMDAGRDVVRNDVVTVAGADYKVVGLLPPSKAHHLKVLLEQVQKGT